jgi:transglutaminase 1
MGRWDEPFKPHRSPWVWVGSAQILNQYYSSNGSPVRYGQCWVFGAVATTLARSLGIPARPVTAYGAGHDSDNSMTIDR